MELRQLEALRLIARVGSFQTAAKQLNLTKSALSHQIGTLEDELGEPLLVRARPKTYATPAGLRLLTSIEKIFAEIGEIKDEFNKSPEAKLTGTLRIAGSNISIAYVYGDLIEEFVTEHRGVNLIFHATEQTDDSVTRVLQRSVDVGFAVFPQTNPNLISTPMVSVEQVFVVGRAHPLARRRIVSIDQLREWPFIRFEEKTGQRLMSDQVFGSNNDYPQIMAELNDVEYAKRLLRMSLGAVALMPIFAVRREIDAGILHGLRLNSGRIVQEGGLVHRADANLRSLDVFIDECVKMRGKKIRMLGLEHYDEPIFGEDLTHAGL
ncbi:LysR family transcriptional regulator [Pigmentiphaga kullae]|uniref:DNA-binding transcriptional LysR family regulator n=1 Tax=Pigmentiphaga kullae TaxID=151784 RepID=A0A4Q7NNK4_9BURK|nr:LysR family transcriptional regulator [Pigmentiphaga kullae]RZS86588.1 DNA-binding transcriptional LysR family regulator [Pigmentiphaga kullae]